MAVFPGNLSLRMTLQLQSRVLSFPSYEEWCNPVFGKGGSWFSRSCQVRSQSTFEGDRADKHEKPETPPAKSPEITEARSMSNADAMSSQVYREGKGEAIENGLVCAEIWSPVDKRMPVIDVIDATPGLGQDTIEDIIETNDDFIEGIEAYADEIEIHQGDNNNIGSELRGGKSRKDAKDLAFQLLATRAYTAVAMTKKLQGNRFPPAIVEAVANDFKRRGFINDGLYAETYS